MLITKVDLAKARVEKIGLVIKGIKVNADYKKYVTNADENSKKDKPKKDKKRFIRTPKTKKNKKDDKQEPINGTKEESTTDFREVKEEIKTDNVVYSENHKDVKFKHASEDSTTDNKESENNSEQKETVSGKEETVKESNNKSKEWINEDKLNKEDQHIVLTEETKNADVVFVNETSDEVVDPAEKESPTEEDKPEPEKKMTNPKPPVRNQRKRNNKKPTTSKEATKERMKQELLNKGTKDSSKDPYIDQNKIINGAKVNPDGSMEGFPIMDDMVIKNQ